MESPRDPLPAYLSAEPDPADPARGPARLPRPRDPGESTEPLRLDESPEPLRLGESAEPLPPSDADLIATCRAGDAAAYDTLCRRHVTAAHSLARQLVRNPRRGRRRGRGDLRQDPGPAAPRRRPGRRVPALPAHRGPPGRLRPAPRRTQAARHRRDGGLRPRRSRRDHRRNPFSPSRIPSARYPSCTHARYSRPGSRAPAGLPDRCL